MKLAINVSYYYYIITNLTCAWMTVMEHEASQEGQGAPSKELQYNKCEL